MPVIEESGVKVVALVQSKRRVLFDDKSMVKREMGEAEIVSKVIFCGSKATEKLRINTVILKIKCNNL